MNKSIGILKEQNSLFIFYEYSTRIAEKCFIFTLTMEMPTIL